MEYNFQELKKQVNASVKEHSTHQLWDSILYNGSVIIAIVASAAATFLIDDTPYIAKILTALTAIVIAIDRSLNWGGRWIYQRQMRHEYLLILARISLVENIGAGFTEEERKKYFLLIFDDLFALQRRESMIPGSEGIKGK